jgi:hypothetical protein
MSEQYSNVAQTTNVASIDSTTNPFSIAVGSPTNFPASTPFRITVCDAAGTNSEVMLVTGTSATSGTTTFTATRGAWSATVAARETPTPTLSTHSAGSTLVHAITAGAMNQIRTDVNRIGSGTLPTDGRAGDIFWPTDDVVAYINNGTTFNPMGLMFPLTNPVLTTFTWANQGTSSATIRTGSLYLRGTTQSGDQVRHYGTNVAGTTPWSYTCGVTPMMIGDNYLHIGFGLTDGTKYEHIGITNDVASSSGCHEIILQKFTNSTTFSTNNIITPYTSWTPTIFFKVRNDGTNLFFSYGPTPFDLTQLYSEAVGAFLGAITQVGFVLDGNNSASTAFVGMLVTHFAVGT